MLVAGLVGIGFIKKKQAIQLISEWAFIQLYKMCVQNLAGIVIVNSR